MASENLASLESKLKDYALANKDIIVSEVVADPQLAQRYNLLDGVKDKMPLLKVAIGNNIAKPGLDSTSWAPSDDAINWSNRELTVRNIKVDLKLVPAQYEKTYLARYMKKGSEVKHIPFEQFIFQEIVKKARQQVHRNAIFKGVYNAAGTTTADTMHGWLKLILVDLALGTPNITPVVTGAITSANVLAKLLLVHDALDEDVKAMNTIMPINSTMFDWLWRLTNPLTNASLVSSDLKSLMAADRNNALQLPGTNCAVIRENGLGASQRVICTTKENMIIGVDSISDDANVKVQEEKRWVNVLMDWKMGVEFADLNSKTFQCNDQA